MHDPVNELLYHKIQELDAQDRSTPLEPSPDEWSASQRHVLRATVVLYLLSAPPTAWWLWHWERPAVDKVFSGFLLLVTGLPAVWYAFLTLSLLLLWQLPRQLISRPRGRGDPALAGRYFLVTLGGLGMMALSGTALVGGSQFVDRDYLRPLGLAAMSGFGIALIGFSQGIGLLLFRSRDAGVYLTMMLILTLSIGSCALR